MVQTCSNDFLTPQRPVSIQTVCRVTWSSLDSKSSFTASTYSTEGSLQCTTRKRWQQIQDCQDPLGHWRHWHPSTVSHWPDPITNHKNPIIPDPKPSSLCCPVLLILRWILWRSSKLTELPQLLLRHVEAEAVRLLGEKVHLSCDMWHVDVTCTVDMIDM